MNPPDRVGRRLLDWLGSPARDRGVHHLDPAREWRFLSYESLAGMALAMAERLRAQGVRRDDVVTVVLDSGPEFVATFFGVLAAGGTVCPVAPPLVFQDSAAYDAHLLRVLQVAQPRTVVTSPEYAARLDGDEIAHLVPSTIVLGPEGIEVGSPAEGARLPADRALLQFTSGSSGPPKAVAISDVALSANVDAIRGWLGMGSDSTTATWLPMHHDMGLIGCMITPVVNQSDVWIMQPEDFIRSPVRWLSCFGKLGAGLTSVPNFGLSYVVRRVTPDALDGFDFSGWDVAIVGAERIESATMQAFHDLLAPHGFRWQTFLPAYGLAEATLAVTGLARGIGARTVAVDRHTLAVGERVTVLPPDQPEIGPSALALVGCGAPLGEGAVRIVDADGRAVPDQTLGEIVVESPSVADGYVGEGGPTLTSTFDAGSLKTGDAGLLYDGELFVLGRLGDSVKRRGRTLFAEDLEEIAVAAAALKPGRIAVLLGSLHGEDTVVVVGEAPPGDWAAATAERLRPHAEGMPVVVASGPRGCLLRTSSGKPKRRPIWEAFVASTLGVEVIHDTGGGVLHDHDAHGPEAEPAPSHDSP